MGIRLCVPARSALPLLHRNWNIGAAQENLQDALIVEKSVSRGHPESTTDASVLATWIVPPQAIASMDGVTSATRHFYSRIPNCSHIYFFSLKICSPYSPVKGKVDF
jgi:hypothetical protein